MLELNANHEVDLLYILQHVAHIFHLRSRNQTDKKIFSVLVAQQDNCLQPIRSYNLLVITHTLYLLKLPVWSAVPRARADLQISLAVL